LIKNSQPFGKNVRKPQGGGDFFDSHCIFIRLAVVGSQICETLRNSLNSSISSWSSKAIDLGVNRKLTCDFVISH